MVYCCKLPPVHQHQSRFVSSWFVTPHWTNCKTKPDLMIIRRLVRSCIKVNVNDCPAEIPFTCCQKIGCGCRGIQKALLFPHCWNPVPEVNVPAGDALQLLVLPSKLGFKTRLPAQVQLWAFNSWFCTPRAKTAAIVARRCIHRLKMWRTELL